MGKKQRERKQRKLQQQRQGNAPPNWMLSEMSPQVRAVMSEMARYSPSKSQQAVMQALMDSAELRQEPELAEFEFDPQHVDKVMARLLPQYEPKLVRAQAKGKEEWEETYYELRVEAIEQLLSRDWRQHFLLQYDAMMRRLGSSADPNKFMQALMVRSVLDDKTLPWGATPLFGEMFEDAKELARGHAAAAEELMQQLMESLGVSGSPEELDKLLQDPQQLAKLEKNLELSPELEEQLDTLTTGIMQTFERALYAGEIDLPLYTDQELSDTTARMNSLTAAVRARGREMGVEDLQALAKVLQERIEEIMTPERLNEMNEQLTLMGDQWLAAGNEDGRLLHMEQAELMDVPPRENSFLYAALVGQLRRLEEPEGEFDVRQYDQEIGDYVIDASDPRAAPEPSTAEQPVDERETRNLRERLRGMFKRPI